MMTSKMILVNGKPNTYRIASYKRIKGSAFKIEWDNGEETEGNVVVLNSRTEVNPDNYHITNRKSGISYNNAEHIWVYKNKETKYYRIKFSGSDNLYEFAESRLEIKKSVFSNDKSKRIFDYLKEIAHLQHFNTSDTENDDVDELISQDSSSTPLLAKKYNYIKFIDQETALASYLNPDLLHTLKGSQHLLFPFYSNLSQMAAVEKALNNQISIIQGPPGTGKTQTILNIIANLLIENKTVLVVSNNNSAVENVKEKLDKEGLGFIVARLGKKDNVESFIKTGQTDYPEELFKWKHVYDNIDELDKINSELKAVYKKQTQLARDKTLLADLELEKEHFLEETGFDTSRLERYRQSSSDRLIRLWVKIDLSIYRDSVFNRLPLWLKMKSKIFKLLTTLDIMLVMGRGVSQTDRADLVTDIKALYYCTKAEELQREINDFTEYLANINAQSLTKRQASMSMQLFKKSLYKKYCKAFGDGRKKFTSTDLSDKSDEVANEYPVVLSTTFSAASTLSNHMFDYVIMDEASQVSIETGALALYRARNAVIVGDQKQLSNIIQGDIIQEMQDKFKDSNLDSKSDEGYNCATNSFLTSAIKVLPEKRVPRTLLREHYRCSPVIINFCNQKFYDGELVIMSKAEDDDGKPMMAIKTFKGHHSKPVMGSKSKINQREVDVIKILSRKCPKASSNSIGIITPYKEQAKLFQESLLKDSDIEADTIHKFQGREKDIVVLSTVVDEYNSFVDAADMINVAVSRAKKNFILITTGNEKSDGKEKHNWILYDLINYIRYHHGIIFESKLHSIFDLLYSCYTKERELYLKGKKDLGVDSENLAYILICDVLKSSGKVNLEVLTHYTLFQLIKDTSLLTEEELRYVNTKKSHVDFLIVNKVGKTPVFAIEVDGYEFHQKGTRQYERDKMKNTILDKYDIPWRRLPTNGSGERGIIVDLIRTYA